ncbi:MAG: NADH-quinone oxidoreductase subunit K [Gammaproteobacteria bacterium]|nr:MAG: NADH-quinone oxidoreductase subunit K [Gammaproteobacteria bacterium]
MTPVGLGHYLALAALLFGIGVFGLIANRRNLIVVLISIELMLLAVNTNFVAFARFLDDPGGAVFVFFNLTVAAAESAVGLAILVVVFRRRGAIDAERLDRLEG